MMAKAAGLPADMVFLDLEDAVAPLEKEGARAKAVDAIKNHDWGDKVLCVRINSWDTKWATRANGSMRSCCPRSRGPPRWWRWICC
jgi:citrate lyase subunit beta/citryl-CoA lyase